MPTTFKTGLENKIDNSIHNYFGIDNYDEARFGKFKQGVKEKVYDKIKKTIGYKSKTIVKPEILKYEDDLQYFWSHLNSKDQDLLIDLIAYRILGYKKIKLPLNNRFYWDSYEKIKLLIQGNDTIDPHFLHFTLNRFDLSSIGYDLQLYFTISGIVTDFIVEQYAYKTGDQYVVQAEKDDTVLDIGGCWGDTALYFAHKVGQNGKVFSFEFIPDNIKIFKKNLELNPELMERIQLVGNPISDSSDQNIYYLDRGPGSQIRSTPFEGQTGSTTTISVDDFVDRYKVPKVDLIKMDIEGAEPAALRGALNTIKKQKPKLAISIYHSMEDFVNIPKWLIDLDLGYEFYLGHNTIHEEETVIYAKPKSR